MIDFNISENSSKFPSTLYQIEINLKTNYFLQLTANFCKGKMNNKFLLSCSIFHCVDSPDLFMVIFPLTDQLSGGKIQC